MLLTPAPKYLISFFTWVRLRYFGCFFFHNNLPQRLQHRAEEVVLQSGALVALAKDPRSALAPDAAACNSPEFQFQRIWALFNPLPVLNVHSPLHKIKIRKNVKTLNVCVNVFAHGTLTVSNPLHTLAPAPCLWNSPDWPWTHYLTKYDFELLILPLPPVNLMFPSMSHPAGLMGYWESILGLPPC